MMTRKVTAYWDVIPCSLVETFSGPVHYMGILNVTLLLDI
jgi:hypothetical protein